MPEVAVRGHVFGLSVFEYIFIVPLDTAFGHWCRHGGWLRMCDHRRVHEELIGSVNRRERRDQALGWARTWCEVPSRISLEKPLGIAVQTDGQASCGWEPRLDTGALDTVSRWHGPVVDRMPVGTRRCSHRITRISACGVTLRSVGGDICCLICLENCDNERRVGYDLLGVALAGWDQAQGWAGPYIDSTWMSGGALSAARQPGMVGQHSTPEWGLFVGSSDTGPAGRGNNGMQISLTRRTQTSLAHRWVQASE